MEADNHTGKPMTAAMPAAERAADAPERRSGTLGVVPVASTP
jgi:hypothetical protein